MRDKVKSLQRINRLQKQLHDLALWKLANATRRKEILEQTVEEVVALSNRSAVTLESMPGIASRYLKSIDKELEVAKTDLKSQANAAIQQGVRASILDRRVAEEAAKVRDIEERKSLSDMSERLLENDGSSSMQAE